MGEVEKEVNDMLQMFLVQRGRVYPVVLDERQIGFIDFA